MKELNEIKDWFINYCIEPKKEEIERYNIDDIMLKTWKAEKAINQKNKLSEEIKELNNILLKKDNKTLATNLSRINSSFHLCVYDDNYFDDYYDEILDIYKFVYEGDYFDFLSYKSFTPLEEEYHNKILFADYYFAMKKPKKEKYKGIIPKYYLCGHVKVFEEVLEYFAKVIFKKYGLYLQYSMEILIKFCKDFNLPYVEMLEEAKRVAIEEDYPNKHSFKYQFIERREEIWGKIKELEPIDLDSLMNVYTRCDDYLFREIDIDYYKINDIVLKNWRTTYSLKQKDELSKLVPIFRQSIETLKDKNEMYRQGLLMSDMFFDATFDRDYNDYYYNNVLYSCMLMYEYNMFDFITIEHIKGYGPNELNKTFADYSKIDSSYLIHYNSIKSKYKYIGIIPSYYYNGHLKEFEEILFYFANTIFLKYGLYLQHSMKVLIEFCKYNKLPYVDLLNKAIEKAKELDYPSNHTFEYEIIFKRKDIKWEI